MPIGTGLVMAAASTAVQSAVNSGVDKIASSGMDVLRNTLKSLALASDGSLVGVSESARVEPECFIDGELSGHPHLSDTLQALQSIFAGYYLRAFAMTTNVGGISVAGRLDPLSTSRNPLKSFIVANEDYEQTLPMYDNSGLLNYNCTLSRESFALEATVTDTDDKGNKSVRTSIVRDDTGIKDASNLAIGKVVNVKIDHNGASAVIPISIRLSCTYMPSNPLASLIANMGENYSFSERFQQMRHGGISFWRDFVLCQDIIDEHKRNLSEDKSGVFLTMMQKRAANNAASLTSGGKVSLNNASNLIIATKETINAVEGKLGINFDSFNQRQNVFENGYMMIIVVVDRRWSRVTFYTRGIKDTTTVSFSDLASIEKGGGSDIGDILAAFRAGTSATL